MADEKIDKACSQTSGNPPPPLDPFPTYQTPYPRSKQQDIENPFIQFRHFADAQIASIFQDLPRVFGTHPTTSDQWKTEFDDMWRRRNEMEEGWKKQFEQEVEEMRQSLERKKADENNRRAQMQAPAGWWTRGDAAQCPALNEHVTPAAKNCPALYDKSGMPKTELDMYESHKPTEVTKPLSGWLGHDGRQQQHSSKVLSKLQQDRFEAPSPQPNMYTRFWSRKMDPVENTNHTVPWLMLSSYSPIYLCNPAQANLFKVHIQDNPGMPLQITRSKFRERCTTELDEKLAQQVPWADAFEDLVSLQQTGKMVEREQNNWRTPHTWIHDMVNRGSLGDRWGFNDEGQLIKKWDSNEERQDRRRCGWGRRRRWNREEQPQQSSQAVSPKVVELPEITTEKTAQHDHIPVFGVIIQSPEDVINAVNQQQHAFDEMMSKFEQTTTTQDHPIAEVATPPQTSSWSTASSSWSSHASSQESESDSIVSSLTTTERRTLPDGSVETKRMLKKRFADGREESNETVEVENSPKPHKYGLPAYQTAIAGQKTQHPVQEQLRQQRRQGGGWFWT